MPPSFTGKTSHVSSETLQIRVRSWKGSPALANNQRVPPLLKDALTTLSTMTFSSQAEALATSSTEGLCVYNNKILLASLCYSCFVGCRIEHCPDDLGPELCSTYNHLPFL